MITNKLLLIPWLLVNAPTEDFNDDVENDGMHMHNFLFVVYSQYTLASTSCKVSLQMILAFFTGADSIPPGGYSRVFMNFNNHNPYPTASTCGLELTLPTKYNNYNDFKKCLDIAFTMHGGFGLY